MMNPQVARRVWAENLIGTFTVVALHCDEGLADLQSTDGNNTLEKRVPLDLIHSVGGDHGPDYID